MLTFWPLHAYTHVYVHLHTFNMYVQHTHRGRDYTGGQECTTDKEHDWCNGLDKTVAQWAVGHEGQLLP